MDILEEIDEKINDKKREWKYTPMREKSETDALIDELLREFSAEGSSAYSAGSRKKTSSYSGGYNIKSEAEEREEYNNSTYVPNEPVSDATQVFHVNNSAASDTGNEYYGDYGNNSEQNFDDNDYYDDDEEDDYSGQFSGMKKLSDDEFVDFLDAEDDRNRDFIREKQSPAKVAFKIIRTAIIAAFAIIGVLSTAIYTLDYFQMMPSDIEKRENAIKDEMQNVIYPFIATDACDFASYSELSSEQIINVCVWEVVINGDMKIFKNDEAESYIIPKDQISYISEKLFGTSEGLENTDAGFSEIEIIYNKETGEYSVPLNTNLYTLYPVVKSAVLGDDNVYTVTAECFADLPAWNDSKKIAPTKTVVFKVKETEGYYNIISAQTV